MTNESNVTYTMHTVPLLTVRTNWQVGILLNRCQSIFHISWQLSLSWSVLHKMNVHQHPSPELFARNMKVTALILGTITYRTCWDSNWNQVEMVCSYYTIQYFSSPLNWIVHFNILNNNYSLSFHVSLYRSKTKQYGLWTTTKQHYDKRFFHIWREADDSRLLQTVISQKPRNLVKKTLSKMFLFKNQTKVSDSLDKQ